MPCSGQYATGLGHDGEDVPRLAQIFRGNRVRQKMSFDAIQRPAYTAADAPEYAGTGHGPWCLGLPNPPVPAGNVKLPDGSDSEDLR